MNHKVNWLQTIFITLALSVLPTVSWAQDIGNLDVELIKGLYYGRVIEIPTPRWVLYDKLRFGAEIPKEATLVHQERAYTSPIWYTP
jgi:hypothetical protein